MIYLIIWNIILTIGIIVLLFRKFPLRIIYPKIDKEGLWIKLNNPGYWSTAYRIIKWPWVKKR